MFFFKSHKRTLTNKCYYYSVSIVNTSEDSPRDMNLLYQMISAQYDIDVLILIS